MGVKRAAEILRNAKYTVAFTGAGISTPSGIPDFRSAKTGLWTKDNPMVVASLSTFKTNPDRFYNWLHPLARDIYHAEPNPAHTALVDLEELGSLKETITQNIDGLHQKAGASVVHEVHGTAATLTCPHCKTQYTAETKLPDYLSSRQMPKCDNCGNILKPDAVLFQEHLPEKTWQAATLAANRCDAMIIIGSSLEVIPACNLPDLALQSGAKIILINNSTTHLDTDAHVVLNQDVATVLPDIVNEIRQ